MRSGVEIHFASGLNVGPSYYGHGEVDAFYLWTGDYPVSAQPLPTVSVSQDSIHQAKRIGATTKISLQGQITGDSTGDFKQLINYQRALRDRFSRSFAPFHIKEEGEIIFSRSNAWVDSITFSESNYSRLIDYTISLNAHDINNWSGYPGDDQTENHVVDLEDSWSFSDSEDGTASISHNVSARGLHEHYSTRGGLLNPVVHAENWVKTRTGSANMPQPFLVGDGKTAYPVLLSNSHNIDKAAGTVSATETYGYNTRALQLEPIMTHSMSIESGIESDFVTVSYDATLKGGQSIRLDDIYASESHMRYVDNAHTYIIGETQVNDLNPRPISFNYSENSGENSITYSATYDNNNLYDNSISQITSANNTAPMSLAYWDYTVSFETDEIRNVTTVSLDGSIKTRGSALRENQIAAQLFIKGLEQDGYAYKIANDCYYDLLSTHPSKNSNDDILEHNYFKAGLHKVPVSFSVNKNHFSNEFSVSCSFSDERINNISIGGGEGRSLSYSVDITPSINQFKPKPSCNQNGHYVVWDTSAGLNEQVTLNIDYQGAGVDNVDPVSVMNTNIDYAYFTLANKFYNQNDLTSMNVVSESQNSNEKLLTASYNSTIKQKPYNVSLNVSSQFLFGKYHDINGLTYNLSPNQ